MKFIDPFHNWDIARVFETLLPDFVLAFALFTSLTFVVLGKRFGMQRPAVVMSASIGLALSFGLVWWEQSNGYSIRSLGPVAVGFAVIFLGVVLYQAIRQAKGSWAGAGIALGASLLVARLLQVNVPFNPQIIQTVALVALVMGISLVILHRRGPVLNLPRASIPLPDLRRSMGDMFRDRHLSDRIGNGLRRLRKRTRTLDEHPEEAGDILLQLKRMLPAEGYLTERMARLRAKAHGIRNGHVARLEETCGLFAKLPNSVKKKAAAELAARYNQIIGMDVRLERLDKAAARNEKTIADLNRMAQTYTVKHDYRKLCDCLKTATRLQRQNSQLFKTIQHTENKLSAMAKAVARQVKQVNKK